MPLDKRQKILLPFILLAFAYIIWQIYDLFFVDSYFKNSKGSFKPSAIIQPTKSQPTFSAQQPEAAPLALNPQSTSPAVPFKEEKPAQSYVFKPPQPSKEIIESTITAEQSEYLKLVNRYNLLKLKHLLLEEEAAIAAAKQRIVKSRSEISSMGGAWEDQLDLEGEPTKLGYDLVYLDYQKGRWNALLNRGGRFFEVHQNMQMANDDQVVIVNKEGVIINHKGQLFQITFDGSRPLSNNLDKSKLIGASIAENELGNEEVEIELENNSERIPEESNENLVEELMTNEKIRKEEHNVQTQKNAMSKPKFNHLPEPIFLSK